MEQNKKRVKTSEFTLKDSVTLYARKNEKLQPELATLSENAPPRPFQNSFGRQHLRVIV